jgi:hypothetical protein
VTRYAVDRERGLLLAIWSTGTGDAASVVAQVPSASDPGSALRLAERLSDLSQALWRCYTHPASAAHSLDVNTTGWRREGNREAFAEVLPALVKPNLPQNGAILLSCIPVEESAHRVGRALHEIGNAELATQVTAEVQAELKAVEQAELGDLSGRARQAVVLTRADASPAQVAAADRLLHEDPLGSDALMSDVDPTAAAVAAAHWLDAAAKVAAEESGLEPEQVVLEADNIEALPHETPTLVLESLANGMSPHAVVTSLIRDAMAVAEGSLPNIDLLGELSERLECLAPHIDLEDPEQREQLMGSLRITPLDPSRPALDLLEDLLTGIHGCWLIYQEYAESPGSPDEPDDVEEDDRDAGEEPDNAYYEARNEELMAAFIEAVRAAAAEEHDRLLQLQSEAILR